MSDTTKLYQFPRVGYTIPLEGNFRNEKKIKVLHRYSEGEGTLIAKDQSKGAKKSYLTIVSNPMPISDPLIQQFLDLMIADGQNIKLYEPTANAKANLAGIRTTLKAMNMIEAMKKEDFIPVAYGLLGRKIFTTEPEIVQELLLAIAQEKPEEVFAVFDTKTSQKTKFFVAEALGYEVIEESYDGLEVTFNGERLVYVSKGESAVEAVANYFETKEGKADYHVVAQAVASKLKRKADDKVAKEVAEKDLDKMNKAELTEKALSLGITEDELADKTNKQIVEIIESK